MLKATQNTLMYTRLLKQQKKRFKDGGNKVFWVV